MRVGERVGHSIWTWIAPLREWVFGPSGSMFEKENWPQAISV